MFDQQATGHDQPEHAQPPEVLDVPPKSVVAVLDDPDAASDLIEALGRQGIARESVEVIRGPVAPQTDLRSRLVRLVQALGEEPDMKDIYEKELNAGHALIVARDVADGDAEPLSKALTAAGARDVHRFGTFTVTMLETE